MQVELARPRLDVPQGHHVKHLPTRHVDVDCAEVFKLAVADEDAAEVEQESTLRWRLENAVR